MNEMKELIFLHLILSENYSLHPTKAHTETTMIQLIP